MHGALLSTGVHVRVCAYCSSHLLIFLHTHIPTQVETQRGIAADAQEQAEEATRRKIQNTPEQYGKDTVPTHSSWGQGSTASNKASNKKKSRRNNKALNAAAHMADKKLRYHCPVCRRALASAKQAITRHMKLCTANGYYNIRPHPTVAATITEQLGQTVRRKLGLAEPAALTRYVCPAFVGFTAG
jgi:hypothetical protein